MLRMHLSAKRVCIQGVHVINFFLDRKLKTCVFEQRYHRVLCHTTYIVFPSKFDVTIYSPGRRPGILNKPVRNSFLLSIADNKYSMACRAVVCGKTKNLIVYDYMWLLRKQLHWSANTREITHGIIKYCTTFHLSFNCNVYTVLTSQH